MIERHKKITPDALVGEPMVPISIPPEDMPGHTLSAGGGGPVYSAGFGGPATLADTKPLQAHGQPYATAKSPYEKAPSMLYINETFRCKTVNEAWEYWYNMLCAMADEGFSIGSRAGISGNKVVGEIINAVTVIENPKDNIVTSPLRDLSIKYGIGEFLWYLSGSNKLSDIRQYGKAWNALSDDGETVNSAYGHRIYTKFGFDQWEFVKDMMKSDPATRQAVIHIKDASNVPTKDTPCTLTLQFFIRGGKLHMIVNMRSNDIWLGFPYDAFTFTCLQQLMAMELGIPVGVYTHIAGSLHLYEKNKR